MINEKIIETKERIDNRRLYYRLKKHWLSREYGYLLYGRFSTWSYEDVIFISKGPYVIEITSRLTHGDKPYSIIVSASMISEKECNLDEINSEIERVARFIMAII